MAVGTVRAVESTAELPRKQNEDQAECQAEESNFHRGDRRRAREDDSIAFVLERGLLPLEVGEENVRLHKCL